MRLKLDAAVGMVVAPVKIDCFVPTNELESAWSTKEGNDALDNFCNSARVVAAWCC